MGVAWLQRFLDSMRVDVIPANCISANSVHPHRPDLGCAGHSESAPASAEPSTVHSAEDGDDMAFVTSRLRHIFVYYALFEAIQLYIRCNPVFSSEAPLLSRGYFLGWPNTIVIPWRFYVGLNWIHPLLAMIAMGTTLHELRSWPVPFGQLIDVYTIWRIWLRVEVCVTLARSFLSRTVPTCAPTLEIFLMMRHMIVRMIGVKYMALGGCPHRGFFPYRTCFISGAQSHLNLILPPQNKAFKCFGVSTRTALLCD
ncbi:hypothetical protein EDC04DRAFT_1424332 [Pisolithus marmoratus]|nr:hypothetical protein EDC04DRAFT_1424332 [Pisolithus marmoratus]